MKKGKCAKKVVTCTIIAKDGERFVGENWCRNPQKECPRNKGEGYEKCKTICDQNSHAEIEALDKAGEKAKDATAYLEGIDYYCKACQIELRTEGVQYLTHGAPPEEEFVPNRLKSFIWKLFKYCPYCGCKESPWFSRTEPMGYHCPRCGKER